MSAVILPGADSNDTRPWDKLMHVLYALHLLSWLSAGIFSIIAMAINYWKRWDAPSDYYRSHFRWQSRSFWFTLIALLVTAPLWVLFVFPGYIAWTLVGLWYLYRFIKGWWYFFERRAMPWPPI